MDGDGPGPSRKGDDPIDDGPPPQQQQQQLQLPRNLRYHNYGYGHPSDEMPELEPPLAVRFEEVPPGHPGTFVEVSVDLRPRVLDPYLDDVMEGGEREITITRNPYFDPSLSPGVAVDDFLTVVGYDDTMDNR